MGKLKGTLVGILVAALLGIAGVVVGLLNEAHLELSFDKLKGFDPLNVGSYRHLLTSLRFDISESEPQHFRAYFGENVDTRTTLSAADLIYKKFRFSNRIKGSLFDEKEGKSFAIGGYYNDERLVFSHRGQISGVGIYILERFDEAPPMYMGYYVAEDVKFEGTKDYWTVQCPIIIIEAKIAAQKYPTAQKARDAFPFLGTLCVEFKLPTALRRKPKA